LATKELGTITAMRRQLSFFVLATILLAVTAAAQSPAGKQRIVTTTRLVAIFSDLERQLMSAVQQKDDVKTQQFLSDDFAVWTPQPPGDPIPQEDWLASEKRKQPTSFRIHQMAVQSLGEYAAVSFVLN